MPEAVESPEARSAFIDRLRNRLDTSDTGAKSWSAVHHTAIVVSVGGSTLAAVIITIPSLDQTWAQVLAAVLAGTSALTTALATGLGFYRKWKVNVTTRAALRNLLNTMETDPDVSLKEAGQRLNAIEDRHSKGIVDEGGD